MLALNLPLISTLQPDWRIILAGVRIDELPIPGLTADDFTVPAMKDGTTYQLTVAQILGIVLGAAPEHLDTLEELANALADDDNFASTVSAAIALKANASDVTAALALKANAVDLTNGLNAKINTADIATLAQILAGTAGKVLTSDIVASRKGASAWVNLNGLSATLFNSIPSTATRLKLMLKSASLNTADNLLVKLGTAGGLVSSGYESSTYSVANAATSQLDSTSGFLVRIASADRIATGTFLMERESTGDWFFQGGARVNDQTATYSIGRVSLGAISQLQVSATTGNFDGGQAKLEWESQF